MVLKNLKVLGTSIKGKTVKLKGYLNICLLHIQFFNHTFGKLGLSLVMGDFLADLTEQTLGTFQQKKNKK